MAERAVLARGDGQPTVSIASKLALVEALLTCDTLVAAARLGAEWLARFGGVHEVVIAVVDDERAPGGARLVGASSTGVDEGAVAALSVDVDDAVHPLVQALTSPRPMIVARARLADVGLTFAAPRCTVHSMPLAADDDRPPVGVVLVGGTGPNANLRWFLGVLGRKLLNLRNLHVLAGTERRLERERALMQSILKSIPDPVLLTDRDGRVVLANPRAELYFTAEDDDSDGRRRAVALNNMLFSSALSPHTIQGAEFARRELPLVDPGDGSDRLFELVSAPIVTSDGPGIVSVLRNVTELQLASEENEENLRRLRAAEAEVRAERDRLDLVIDSVADPIIVTDAHGATIMTNAPAERLFTTTRSASAEAIFRVRANDALLSSHVANLFILAPTGRFRGELRLVDPKTGAHVPVEAISGKILAGDGEVSGVVTILHDQTEALEKARLYEELKGATALLEVKVRDATAELVRRNELLQRQAIELEAASSAKSQFLANMSHEFRTPLNAILGYTSLMLQGVSGPIAPPITRQLSRVDSNAKHLLTIINDILDIARIEAGKMPLNLERFAIPELVREVLAEVEPLIDRTKLVVRADLGRKLPVLRSDRAKVKQILMNLISNALKFTPGGSVTVSARATRRSDEVTLSVVDTGIGIAEKDREAVFQDFRQVDNSPTRQYGGTGLGLAICRRLAAVLGGQMRLTSEPGRGSTFTLVLPGKGGPR